MKTLYVAVFVMYSLCKAEAKVIRCKDSPRSPGHAVTAKNNAVQALFVLTLTGKNIQLSDGDFYLFYFSTCNKVAPGLSRYFFTSGIFYLEDKSWNNRSSFHVFLFRCFPKGTG